MSPLWLRGTELGYKRGVFSPEELVVDKEEKEVE